MALYRYTFFFEQGENGWSESIHTSLTSTSDLISGAQSYLRNRMALCNSDVFCSHVRISDDLVFRDVILDPFPLPIPGTFPKTTPSGNPWTALDVRMSSGPLVQRSLFLRGIPQNQSSGAFPSFTGSYQTAFNVYVLTIVDSIFSIKNKDRTQVKQPINSISGAGVVNMAAPIPGLGDLQTVQILGVPRSIVKQRLFVVHPFVDTSNFTIRGWPAGLTLGATGYLRRNVFVLSPILFAACDAVTERRVGRPFGLLRGRRAVVR